jgi:hypothetical protein
VSGLRFSQRGSAMNRQLHTLALFLSLASGAFASAGAANLTFHAAPGQEPVTGRYVVTLDSSVAADAAIAASEALARSYCGQLDQHASSYIRQFAIAMLPANARALSADPRVRRRDRTTRRRHAAAPVASITRHLVPAVQDISSSGTYLYDGSGNIKSIGTDSFLYDVDGRLWQATVQGNEQNYRYDAFGNRTNTWRGTNAAACIGGCEASLTAVPQSNHLSGVTYDDAGNVARFI